MCGPVPSAFHQSRNVNDTSDGIFPIANHFNPAVKMSFLSAMSVQQPKKRRTKVARSSKVFYKREKCMNKVCSPFFSAAFSDSFSFSRAAFRDEATLCCNLTIGSSGLRETDMGHQLSWQQHRGLWSLSPVFA